MADHPRYPGIDRLILLGDEVHEVTSMRSGVVYSMWSDGDVIIRTQTDPCDYVRCRSDDLRIGPAPIELIIKPTRDKLRTWVAAHDEFGSEQKLPRGHIIAAIPADLLAELRAEIEAERQS